MNFVWGRKAELDARPGLITYMDMMFCMSGGLYEFSLYFCLMGSGGLPSGLSLKFSIRTKAKPHVKTPTPESSKLLNECSRRDLIKGQGYAMGHFWKIEAGKGAGWKTQAEEWRQGEDKGNQRMQPEVNSLDARENGKQPQEILSGF